MKVYSQMNGYSLMLIWDDEVFPEAAVFNTRKISSDCVALTATELREMVSGEKDEWTRHGNELRYCEGFYDVSISCICRRNDVAILIKEERIRRFDNDDKMHEKVYFTTYIVEI